MGNSATKEQRPPNSQLGSSNPQDSSSPAGSGPTSPAQASFLEQFSQPNAESSTERRPVRPEFFTSMAMNGEEERVPRGTEWRKETKQEREARKLEKERAVREKERERSMRDEHVDGGYLVTQGVYTGTEDYNKAMVRQLMIERRIAPFWRGLNDHQESWTENQLFAAARGLPIPAADEIPQDDEDRSESPPESTSQPSIAKLDSSTIPITGRSQSQNSETSSNQSSPFQSSFPPVSNTTSSIGSALAKGRSKTLATLTNSSKSLTVDMRPREIRLPKEINVNGQRLEAFLYKDAGECPICFLYYPPYLNKTRCCDQEMCSECFVQIKRPDPHPPEHADPTAPPPPPGEIEGHDGEFVSEPATCPFCKVPQFGITYDPPPFRRGIVYANHPSGHVVSRSFSGTSSASSLASAGENTANASPAISARRRTMSVSATSPNVISTDQIRPDWSDKLAAARAHAARRSAAATALHTAAYLMGNRGHEDARGFGGFGRRGLLRRTSGGEGSSYGTPQSQLNVLSLMSDRNAIRGIHREGGPPLGLGAHGGSRPSRVDEIEDIMMMEAIRLSLASEEERRKREDKDAKKEAKKKEKETKKAEKESQKAAKRSGLYPSSANASASTFPDPFGLSTKGKHHQMDSGQDARDNAGGILTPSTNPQFHLERARAQIQGDGSPSPSSAIYNPAPVRPSHLRTQSNVSSSASSMEGGSAPGSLLQDPREPGSSLDVSPAGSRINIPGAGLTQEPFISGTPPGGGAGTEPMFNFRSLAAMVGDDDDHDREVEHAGNGGDEAGPASEHHTHPLTAAARNEDDLSLQLGGEGEQAAKKTPNQYETALTAPEDAVSP